MPKTASNFQRNLLVGSGVSLLLLIISGIASIISIQNLLYSSRQVGRTNEIIRYVDESLAAMIDAETGQRGYLLTGITEFLDPYRGAAEKFSIATDKIKTLTKDNDDQRRSAEALKKTISAKISNMQVLISDKIAGREIQIPLLQAGKRLMDEGRRHAAEIKARETQQLEDRTARLNKFAAYTPIFIFLASLLGLTVTTIFYFRVRTEYNKSAALREELAVKDEDITRRIKIIEAIAGKIAAGDYSTRVPEDGEDGLGALSGSLNHMAGALEKAFDELALREWSQTGTAEIAEEMLGEKTLKTLCDDILGAISRYTNSLTGAIYLLMKDGTLKPVSGYGIAMESLRPLAVGEGLAGQAAVAGLTIATPVLPAAHLTLPLAGGNVSPAYILAAPIMYEGRVHAVLELGSVEAQPEPVQAWLRDGLPAVGIGMQTAVNRTQLQNLLHETQAQTEELQTQQEELENLNAELEAQTSRLQASEEELRVQQEELVQANEELNERAAMLEERNQLIAERNIEIQKRSEDLALSSKYKSEFLANMSHELRTPLNSILLLSRLLGDNASGNLSAEQVEYTTVIRSSGQGLLSLIDDILDLSRIEAGRMDLEWQSVTIASIVEEMKGLFGPVAKDKGLQLKIEVAADAQTVIETDRQRLSQVLRNLLSNATKFTKEGSVTFGIAAGATPGFAKFSVQDTGIGIAGDKQKLIFEAFQQADGSTQRSYGGTGLGLSISRELARLLGGTLEVSSEPGKGSTFILTVPVVGNQARNLPAESIETAAVVPVPEKDDVLPTPAANRNREPNPTLIPASIPDDRLTADEGKGVILIVEDDTAFAQSLLDFTRSRGYRGVVAVRGDEALPLAQEHQPVAILLDIRLPVKNGWEVMEELKTNPSTRHIPVHMMSASSESRKESIQQGAVDFMAKPLAFEEMSKMFTKLEDVLTRSPKKVLIVEENAKHAEALSTFLSGYGITSHTAGSVQESISLLQGGEVDCVVLDMGVPNAGAYETLEEAKRAPGLENLPIIVFTGRSLSRSEAERIRRYADTVVLKTAHSYRRLLDEVSLFLHLMEEQRTPAKESAGTSAPKFAGKKDILQGKTILVADDDVRNIFSLTKALEQHGVHVVSATDGKEALDVLAANPKTNLVLMDMMMPEMDGYESIRLIRKSPKTKSLPVIAVTAKTMLGDREKCIEAGASDYISKPIDLDQLLSLLRVWLYDKSS